MADQETERVIVGQYVCLPNPCTTEPCLPGMAYAVECEGQAYFLTLGGRWSPENRAWSGWVPVEGDQLKVAGRVTQSVDRRGARYATIEARSVTLVA